MTKKQMVEYIDKNYDWYNSMRVGLGHHSWWYTKRSPEQCINVKIYAWVDTDAVLALLTPAQVRVFEALHINAEEYFNESVWGEFGTIAQAREDLELELKEKHNVTDLEYGGRSGGWLAVVYKWNCIDDYDQADLLYSEVLERYESVRDALAEHATVTALVLERKRALEKSLEDPENYIDQLRDYISSVLESKQVEARRVLAIIRGV